MTDDLRKRVGKCLHKIRMVSEGECVDCMHAELTRLRAVAERVPHLAYGVHGITVVVADHDGHPNTLGERVTECRALGGRCAWEEAR